VISDWERYAAIEYDRLVAEEGGGSSEQAAETWVLLSTQGRRSLVGVKKGVECGSSYGFIIIFYYQYYCWTLSICLLGQCPKFRSSGFCVIKTCFYWYTVCYEINEYNYNYCSYSYIDGALLSYNEWYKVSYVLIGLWGCLNDREFSIIYSCIHSVPKTIIVLTTTSVSKINRFIIIADSTKHKHNLNSIYKSIYFGSLIWFQNKQRRCWSGRERQRKTGRVSRAENNRRGCRHNNRSLNQSVQ